MRHLPVGFARRTPLLPLMFCLVSCLLTGCASISEAQKVGQIAATLEEADRQFSLDHDKAALIWCDRAIAILPHSPVPYVGDTSVDDQPDMETLVSVLQTHGRYPELAAYLSKAVIDPKLADNWQILQALGDAQTHIGDAAGSKLTYSKMLAALTKSMKTAGASISPNYQMAKADAEWNAGDQAAAEKDYQNIITTQKREEADLARNNYAYELAVAKVNLPEALSMATQAVADARDDDNDEILGIYLDTLGWIEHQMGKDNDAVFHIQEAVSLSPNTADVHFHLAEIYRALNERDEAAIEYRQTIALDPSNKDAQAGLSAVQAPA